MKSFDFYDTLVTRLVARPADIFRLVEERIGLNGFAQMRVDAEMRARRGASGREITLAQIYSELNLTSDLRERAQAIELHLETALTVQIRQNIERMSVGDLIVSDMYLSSEILRSILCACRVAQTDMPRVLVSSEVGKRKADGGIWDYLRTESPHLRWHIGDNFVADVKHPRRRGIEAEHFLDATLSRYEQRYVDGSLDGSLVAGCARGARLACVSQKSTDEECASASAFASVFAPVFVDFVEWVLEDCLKQGIRRVFFLARDGQLLYRIACQLIAARALPLEPHYIYGSRHALHLPGFTDIDSAESWLLEDTPILSLRDVAERAGVTPELVGGIGLDYGLFAIDENIRPPLRDALKGIVRDPRFLDAIATVSRERWENAFAYYHSAGFHDEPHVALVDVGWSGRMQASLRQLLSKSTDPAIRITGYYLCLSKMLRVSDLDRLDGFLHNPERGRAGCFYDSYRGVIEAALSADHATTIGFADRDGKAEPLLGRPPSGAEVERVRQQQEAVMNFVSLLLRAERALGRRIRIDRRIAEKNLQRYLTAPSQTDAMAFHSRQFFEGQVESRAQTITTQVRLGPDLLRRSALGFWPEGSIAASGLGALLPVLRVARSVKKLSAPKR